MSSMVGIRFRQASKIYYFDTAGLELAVGDMVMVETERGRELGKVAIPPSPARDEGLALKPVLGKATPEDLKQAQEARARECQAMQKAREMTARLHLPMKLLSAESNLEGNHFTFLFSAEGRVDFRELARELHSALEARVDLKQVGPRDEAKLVGGYGHCGRPLCCASHLTEFAPVSIRMAKEQDQPLNPAKISGLCGRLLCCLAYEIEHYRLLRAKLPKRGQKVQTPMGPATVAWVNPLTEKVIVQLEESQATLEYPADQVKVKGGGKPEPLSEEV